MKSKLWLLLDYMEHNGISEDFVNELEDCTEYAQESFANTPELAMTADEEQAIMKRLNAVMDREILEAVNA